MLTSRSIIGRGLCVAVVCLVELALMLILRLVFSVSLLLSSQVFYRPRIAYPL